jgi:hypothetical protein
MRSIKHSAGFDISQPVEKVFPLFSPEGEKLWVPNWDNKNIMGTTELSEDYVFLTATHDHASTDAIWLVKRYEPKAWFALLQVKTLSSLLFLQKQERCSQDLTHAHSAMKSALK